MLSSHGKTLSLVWPDKVNFSGKRSRRQHMECSQCSCTLLNTKNLPLPGGLVTELGFDRQQYVFDELLFKIRLWVVHVGEILMRIC